jgi:saccharopine dehydrogenase-like NADP-dependent oxidoreductase
MVCGLGAVGARVARYLISSDDVGTLLVFDSDRKRRAAVAASLGARARVVEGPDDVEGQPIDIVVLATPASRQAALASAAIAAGRHVVATADSLAAVRSLLDLDAEARERGVSVVVGAGFSPGLSCVLTRHAAALFDQVDEIHVARSGTGGPACARQHHNALLSRGIDWRDRAWERRPPGSGRELSFFPDPIGGADCYRASCRRPQAGCRRARGSCRQTLRSRLGR